MRRRITRLLLAAALASFGLVGFAQPASAYCIDTGIDDVGCVTICIPGPGSCPQ